MASPLRSNASSASRGRIGRHEAGEPVVGRAAEQESPKRLAARAAQKAAETLESLAGVADSWKSSGHTAAVIVEFVRCELREQGNATRAATCGAVSEEMQALRAEIAHDMQNLRAEILNDVASLAEGLGSLIESEIRGALRKQAGECDKQMPPAEDDDPAASAAKSVRFSCDAAPADSNDDTCVAGADQSRPTPISLEDDDEHEAFVPTFSDPFLPGPLTSGLLRQEGFPIMRQEDLPGVPSDGKEPAVLEKKAVEAALERRRGDSESQHTEESNEGRPQSPLANARMSSAVSPVSTGKRSTKYRASERPVQMTRMTTRMLAWEIAPEETLKQRLAVWVTSQPFDFAVGTCIALNAILVGAQTEFKAHNIGADPPAVYRVADVVFCVVFTLELFLKLGVYGRTFYHVLDWKWNAFDSVVVALQLFEEFLAIANGSAELIGMNLSFMRVLRVLRLIKIIRLFRVLRIIGELRTLVTSIAGCMRPLFWAILLLCLMIYTVGVFFTQAVTMYFEEEIHAEKDAALLFYFGSLGKSIFALYQAVLGGVDWGDIANPLTGNISPVYGVVFACYIAFACLAMMNVVTGCFVEGALASAKRDRDVYMVNHLKQLLKATDADSSGHISWEEFQAQLGNPQMIEYFRNIDIDISEGRSLFKILDARDQGFISKQDFINGCMRLRGPARALELERLNFQTRRSLVKFSRQLTDLTKMLSAMCKLLDVKAASAVPAGTEQGADAGSADKQEDGAIQREHTSFEISDRVADLDSGRNGMRTVEFS